MSLDMSSSGWLDIVKGDGVWRVMVLLPLVGLGFAALYVWLGWTIGGLMRLWGGQRWAGRRQSQRPWRAMLRRDEARDRWRRALDARRRKLGTGR
jgi:hypothetical protein